MTPREPDDLPHDLAPDFRRPGSGYHGIVPSGARLQVFSTLFTVYGCIGIPWTQSSRSGVESRHAATMKSRPASLRRCVAQKWFPGNQPAPAGVAPGLREALPFNATKGAYHGTELFRAWR